VELGNRRVVGRGEEGPALVQSQVLVAFGQHPVDVAQLEGDDHDGAEDVADLLVGVDYRGDRLERADDHVVQPIVHEHRVTQPAEGLGRTQGIGFAERLQVVDVQDDTARVGIANEEHQVPQDSRPIDHQVPGADDRVGPGGAAAEAERREAAASAREPGGSHEHLGIAHGRSVGSGCNAMRVPGIGGARGCSNRAHVLAVSPMLLSYWAEVKATQFPASE
jgi:hypothetical protein